MYCYKNNIVIICVDIRNICVKVIKRKSCLYENNITPLFRNDYIYCLV